MGGINGWGWGGALPRCSCQATEYEIVEVEGNTAAFLWRTDVLNECLQPHSKKT